MRGDDKKRAGQGAGFTLNADLFFFHGFEQGALGFGAGAVDFVCQQHLGEQRAGVKDKFFLGAVKHRHAREVAGHQVGGELHARKLQPKGACQGMRQRGFADARHVFNQQVPTSQQTGHTVLRLVKFSNHHGVKLIQ